MNYGYECKGWSKAAKARLASALVDIIATLPEDERGQVPYVEQDSLYDGVRVRRITHYSEEQIEDMTTRFDEAYLKVDSTRPRIIGELNKG